VADLDVALVEDVLDVPERYGGVHVKHHREVNDLG
jgi:hypothetical protein